MSLRERIRDWKLPLLSPAAVPERMAIARKVVEEQYCNVQPRQPSKPDLDLLFNAVSTHFRSKKRLEGLNSRDIRQISFILFTYPEATPGSLAEDGRFCDEYLDWLIVQLRPTCISTLLFFFLREYPTHLRTFDRWRNGLILSLNKSHSSRLRLIRKKCEDFHLLSANGPEKFAEMMLDGNIPKNELLNEAGLVNRLQVQGFARIAYLEVLKKVRQKLCTGHIQDTLMERLFSFALVESERGKRLRFEADAKDLAEALLLPYADSKAHWAHQKAIQSFLVGTMGDPRIAKNYWIGVNSRAKGVMFGWLVEATLDMFFTILDKTADETWRYRKAFWGAYFKRGYIRQAWVVLGARAISIARQIDDRKIKFGRLGGAGGNQSVLLLQIGDLIMAEWSHCGKCRIWKDNEANRQKIPKFYDTTSHYRAFSLRRPADFEQVHYSSGSGNWQSKVEGYIRLNTNIRISKGEYMP